MSNTNHIKSSVLAGYNAYEIEWNMQSRLEDTKKRPALSFFKNDIQNYHTILKMTYVAKHHTLDKTPRVISSENLTASLIHEAENANNIERKYSAIPQFWEYTIKTKFCELLLNSPWDSTSITGIELLQKIKPIIQSSDIMHRHSQNVTFCYENISPQDLHKCYNMANNKVDMTKLTSQYLQETITSVTRLFQENVFIQNNESDKIETIKAIQRFEHQIPDKATTKQDTQISQENYLHNILAYLWYLSMRPHWHENTQRMQLVRNNYIAARDELLFAHYKELIPTAQRANFNNESNGLDTTQFKEKFIQKHGNENFNKLFKRATAEFDKNCNVPFLQKSSKISIHRLDATP